MSAVPPLLSGSSYLDRGRGTGLPRVGVPPAALDPSRVGAWAVAAVCVSQGDRGEQDLHDGLGAWTEWEGAQIPDAINALAAEAAAAYPGGAAYSYAAQDALTARILIVEEGGVAFPQGSGIGAPGDDVTGKWSGILDGAGFEPGMYSWWNAVPCGLDRPLTAQDKGRGRSYLNRVIALHTELYAVIAVGSVAQNIVKATRTSSKVLTTRSPLRSSNAERERIRKTFVQARLDAYPSASTRADDVAATAAVDPKVTAAPVEA